MASHIPLHERDINELLRSAQYDDTALMRREAEVARETDEEILKRMACKFSILEKMTHAAVARQIRSMIVTGPPGIGKSFGVESVLERAYLFQPETYDIEAPPKFQIIHGSISALLLYAKLHEFRNEGSVLVLDDADKIFFDEESLMLLKAALDTSNRRILSWNKDSRLLRSKDIPDRFEFKGAVIVITNLKFAYVRSKKLKTHLDAIESRCHYLDMELDTMRERLLRIQQVVRETGMLDRYCFTTEEQEELLNWVHINQTTLREVSLRTLIKASQLKVSFKDDWRMFASNTLIKSK